MPSPVRRSRTRLGRGRGDACLAVNGQRIFCRGANWIPDDAFPSRITAASVTASGSSRPIGANMNMLRVWGGGIYEDHAFYEACDELGIMVWQDFALACACYSEDEPFATEIDLEARDNVSRLARHPSLVMWNGGNEILLALDAWGYDKEVGDRPWGGKYLFETFPNAVAEIDPSRPYWPNSPFSGMLDDHTHRHTRVEEYGSLAHLGRLARTRQLSQLPRTQAPLRCRIRLSRPAHMAHHRVRHPARPSAVE